MHFPKNLEKLLQARRNENMFRSLKPQSELVDFSSNDYLGFSRSAAIAESASLILGKSGNASNGSTGSRLLSGNQPIHLEAESLIKDIHQSEAALLYNSGYDANVGFFSAVPQRGDVIIYDELCHASIRDGIRLSHAKAFRFAHNDLEDLEALIEKHKPNADEIYIATESVFSMDGDSPALSRLSEVATKYQCLLVVDEAHALGIFGKHGCGLIQDLHLQDQVFARIVTFGKGLGCHGAVVLGSQKLTDFLVNFSRSFIYTTAMSPHSAATIIAAYQQLGETDEIEKLRDNILHFNRELSSLGTRQLFVSGKSAIQSAIIPGNEQVKGVAEKLQGGGFDVRPILSPTVPAGQERLRFCIHSFNSTTEISDVLRLLATFVYE